MSPRRAGLASARPPARRSRFAELYVRHGELSMQTTISLGVTAYPNHGHTAEELTQSADLALYLAKHDGRNRVTVFEAAPLTLDV
jgi:diguanylate cyclase (GGDEF)-like protein